MRDLLNKLYENFTMVLMVAFGILAVLGCKINSIDMTVISIIALFISPIISKMFVKLIEKMEEL